MARKKHVHLRVGRFIKMLWGGHHTLARHAEHRNACAEFDMTRQRGRVAQTSRDCLLFLLVKSTSSQLISKHSSTHVGRTSP